LFVGDGQEMWRRKGERVNCFGAINGGIIGIKKRVFSVVVTLERGLFFLGWFVL
jgi:hypothetical protein